MANLALKESAVMEAESHKEACTYAVEVKDDGFVYVECPEGGTNWRLVELRPEFYQDLRGEHGFGVPIIKPEEIKGLSSMNSVKEAIVDVEYEVAK